MTWMRVARVAGAIALLFLAVMSAISNVSVAQSLRGAATGFNLQRRIYYQGAVYEQTGLWYGGEGSARLGLVRIGLSGLFGTLKGDGTVLNPNVTARTTAATLDVAVTSWAALGVRAEARRFEADASVTSWRLIGGSVRLEPGLGLLGLRGIAEVALLPASSVSGGPSLKMAVQAAVGAALDLPRNPVFLRLVYRFERYDIEAAGSTPERYEQFRGIVAEAGIRVGR